TSLSIPDACLRDNSICSMRSCACIYPCAIYKSCSFSALICGTPLSSVVTTTSFCRFGKSIVPSCFAKDLVMYAVTTRNTMSLKTARMPKIIKVIFVLFLFLFGLIGSCFIGISITYPPLLLLYYCRGRKMHGVTRGRWTCPLLLAVSNYYSHFGNY